MSFPFYMALPLLAAFLYAYGSLFLKEAFEHGITLIHSFVITSWMMGVVFAPLLFIAPPSLSISLLVQPFICALLFFAGNWLTFAAIRRGDMSLIVPVMGTKAVFVALGASIFFGKSIHPEMWIAALLAAIGIYILGRSDRSEEKSTIPAVALTIMSACSFGFCDAAIQAWAPSYGSERFLGTTFLMIAILSSLFLKIAEHPIVEADRFGIRVLCIGAGIIALQGILVAISVVGFDNATGVNVVYASRGLWSVLLVWCIGHRFRSHKHPHRRAFYKRLLGAGVMIVAVALALQK